MSKSKSYWVLKEMQTMEGKPMMVYFPRKRQWLSDRDALGIALFVFMLVDLIILTWVLRVTH